jgi:hypothetical protein
MVSAGMAKARDVRGLYASASELQDVPEVALVPMVSSLIMKAHMPLNPSTLFAACRAAVLDAHPHVVPPAALKEVPWLLIDDKAMATEAGRLLVALFRPVPVNDFEALLDRVANSSFTSTEKDILVPQLKNLRGKASGGTVVPEILHRGVAGAFSSSMTKAHELGGGRGVIRTDADAIRRATELIIEDVDAVDATVSIVETKLPGLTTNGDGGLLTPRMHQLRI